MPEKRGGSERLGNLAKIIADIIEALLVIIFTSLILGAIIITLGWCTYRILSYLFVV